jgi:hypothetical protein
MCYPLFCYIPRESDRSMSAALTVHVSVWVFMACIRCYGGDFWRCPSAVGVLMRIRAADCFTAVCVIHLFSCCVNPRVRV